MNRRASSFDQMAQQDAKMGIRHVLSGYGVLVQGHTRRAAYSLPCALCLCDALLTHLFTLDGGSTVDGYGKFAR